MSASGSDASPAPDPSWSGAFLAALLTTLEQSTLWVVSLAGFLARGGLLAFLLPIVVIPTPAGVQVVIAPLLVPVVFGQVPVGLLIVGGVVAGLVGAWLVTAGLIGGWADLVAVRNVAEAVEPLEASPPRPGGDAASASLVRVLAHVPLAAALVFGAFRLVQATYTELLVPFEVVTPLLLRIVAAAPDALALILVTWLLGEAAGGLAVRELALGGRGVLGAVGHGWLGLVRRPAGSAATLLATTLLLAVAILPGLVASGTAWARLRFLLFEGGRPEEIVLALCAFVALWLGGLGLAGVATAVRSAAWTAEWLRQRVARPATIAAAEGSAVGTIGAAEATDRGGWPPSGASGTL